MWSLHLLLFPFSVIYLCFCLTAPCFPTHTVVIYMSPECMAGRASFPSDLWSLGLTALHLATGKVPWSHVRDDMGNVMNEGQLLFHIAQRCNSHPLPGDLPDWLRRALQGCMAYQPEERPTCQGLLDFLSLL